MTKEEAIKEIEKAFEPAFANYIITALTEGATVSDKELTTKNDLGVDCISRADAIRVASGYCHPSNVAKELAKMPSVTPIRPKGHWILTVVEGDRVWHCNCSECGKDPQDYVGGSENWWLIKGELPKFCPSCASDMSEVEHE